MSPYPIHVGSLIRVELSRQHKSVSWLAEQLGIQRPNCYRILNAQSLQTELLYRLCRVTQHDFFLEISNRLFLTVK
jgi:plasmid maintenance system antidote protein VapI